MVAQLKEHPICVAELLSTCRTFSLWEEPLLTTAAHQLVLVSFFFLQEREQKFSLCVTLPAQQLDLRAGDHIRDVLSAELRALLCTSQQKLAFYISNAQSVMPDNLDTLW